MNERRWGTPLAVLLGGTAVLLMAWAMLRGDSGASEVSKKSAQSDEKNDVSVRESRALLPKELASVHLSMSESELLRARPRAKRNEEGKEPGWDLFDETLGDGRRVLYMIGTTSHALDRVQIAERLSGVEAIEPRLQDMGGLLGPPSGVWDCPPAADMFPTRRFTWLRERLGVMDSYLLLGNAISVTQMISSREAIRTSIQISRCVPVPPDRFTKFPALPTPSAAPTNK